MPPLVATVPLAILPLPTRDPAAPAPDPESTAACPEERVVASESPAPTGLPALSLPALPALPELVPTVPERPPQPTRTARNIDAQRKLRKSDMEGPERSLRRPSGARTRIAAMTTSRGGPIHEPGTFQLALDGTSIERGGESRQSLRPATLLGPATLPRSQRRSGRRGPRSSLPLSRTTSMTTTELAVRIGASALAIGLTGPGLSTRWGWVGRRPPSRIRLA
jgi:hypothetical protein